MRIQWTLRLEYNNIKNKHNNRCGSDKLRIYFDSEEVREKGLIFSDFWHKKTRVEAEWEVERGLRCVLNKFSCWGCSPLTNIDIYWFLIVARELSRPTRKELVHVRWRWLAWYAYLRKRMCETEAFSRSIEFFNWNSCYDWRKVCCWALKLARTVASSSFEVGSC